MRSMELVADGLTSLVVIALSVTVEEGASIKATLALLITIAKLT